MSDADATYIGCPNCGVRYRWRNELASKKILCPCGCKFRMPNIAAGPPTTITLPPKGNAVSANAGLRSSDNQAGAEPAPIPASDAVGELARLHLLDDLKQKIDNDGTLNSGRTFVTTNPDRVVDKNHPRDSGPAMGDNGRLQLDLDDPLIPTEPDAPAAQSSTTSSIQEQSSTADYELNLDAFTPASSVLSPADSSITTDTTPKPDKAAMSVGETLSRVDQKKRKKEEEDEEYAREHSRQAYVYPLACIIVGILLIFLNIYIISPRIDTMEAAMKAEKAAQIAQRGTGHMTITSFWGGGNFEDTTPTDESDRPVKQDNSRVVVSVGNAAVIKPPATPDGKGALSPVAHGMSATDLAKNTNPSYNTKEALYHQDVIAPIKLTGRSIGYVIMIFLSTFFGFVGILTCSKLLGSSFDGLISTMLKLIAIAFVLQGSLGCVEGGLDLITEGMGAQVGWMMIRAIGYGLFWAMCAWLLEMNPIEITIMYVCIYILPGLAAFTLAMSLLSALGI